MSDEKKTETSDTAARWAAFTKEAFALAEQHKLVGLALTGVYLEFEADGKTPKALPNYATASLPEIGSPRIMYGLRDQMMSGLKNVVDQSIENMLKSIEAKVEAAKAAPPAEAAPAPADMN